MCVSENAWQHILSYALTITPLAGGTRPVSAHLVITQIG